MRLVGARLVEVCQHKDLNVEFTPGLTLIIGPNGSGKSNLVNLIRASLTNDFSSMGGVKSDNIRRGRADGTPSYVETTWHIKSGVMVVRRGLAGCSSSLVINGEEVVGNREDDISKEVLKRTDLTAAKVNDFLFADQDRLQDVIAGTKGRRAELFSSLCGIEVMQAIDRNLRETLNGDKALIENFDQNRLDQNLFKWAEARDKIRELRQQANSLSEQLMPEEQLERYRNHLQTVKTRSELLQSLSTVRERVRRQEKKIPDLKLRRNKEAAAVTDFDEKLTKVSDRLAKIRSRRSEAKHEFAAAKRYAKAKKVLDKPAPEEVTLDGVVDTTKLEAACYKLQGKVNWLRQVIKLAEKGELEYCSKCGSPVDAIKGHAEEHKRELAELEPKLIRLEKKLERIERQKEAYDQYEKDLSAWTSEQRAAQDVVDEIDELYPSGPKIVDLTELEEQIEALGVKRDKLANKLRELRDSHLEVNSQLSAAKQQLADAKAQLVVLQQQFEELPNVEKDVDVEAESVVEAQKKLREDLADVQSTLRSKRTEAKYFAEDIRRLRAEKRKYKRTRVWVDYAEKAREILKKDRLPAKIIAGMLGRTTLTVNGYLEQLGVPFRVQAELKNFSFEAIHADGTQEPASRLSVGQKTCLAIAFWLARAEVFIGSLPFFCLDEPTAHLDTSRVAHVADLFESLSTKLYSEGRQGIVITHHAELSRVATNTIQL